MGPQIAVEFVGSGGLWPTKVDASQLESALLNLCINARDAMPDGGRVTIEIANNSLDERAARERELPPGQYLCLSVAILMALACNSRRIDGWDWVLSVIIPAYGLMEVLFNTSCR
jgi:signal transduction histidine kinase